MRRAFMGAYLRPVWMASLRPSDLGAFFGRIFFATRFILASILSGFSQIAVSGLLPCKATLKVLAKIASNTIAQIG